MGRMLTLDVFPRASLRPPDPERYCQHCSQCCKRYDELVHSTPPGRDCRVWGIGRWWGRAAVHSYFTPQRSVNVQLDLGLIQRLQR